MVKVPFPPVVYRPVGDGHKHHKRVEDADFSEMM